MTTSWILQGIEDVRSSGSAEGPRSRAEMEGEPDVHPDYGQDREDQGLDEEDENGASGLEVFNRSQQTELGGA